MDFDTAKTLIDFLVMPLVAYIWWDTRRDIDKNKENTDALQELMRKLFTDSDKKQTQLVTDLDEKTSKRLQQADDRHHAFKLEVARTCVTHDDLDKVTQHLTTVTSRLERLAEHQAQVQTVFTEKLAECQVKEKCNAS
jgi:hypothetical protein